MFAVRKILETKHGLIKDLVLCKEVFREINEMKEDKKTLEEYGILGDIVKEGAPKVTICYDFKPLDSDSPDPILLSWVN